MIVFSPGAVGQVSLRAMALPVFLIPFASARCYGRGNASATTQQRGKHFEGRFRADAQTIKGHSRPN
jgi:hypothetical protein